MSTLLLNLIGIIAMSFTTSATVEKKTVKTSYGATIPVEVTRPAGSASKTPAVVLASGQAYHMGMPIQTKLADRLAASGVAVFRFNYGFFVKDPNKGVPSKDRATEMEDMKAVVALASADSRIDSDRMGVAGKSLGSQVAYRVFRLNRSLKALALLTPTVTTRSDDNGKELPAPISRAETSYPAFGETKRPVMFATSTQDPMCDLKMLFDFLENEPLVPVTAVAGDHSWQVSPDAGDLRTVANVDLGVSFVADWLIQTL